MTCSACWSKPSAPSKRTAKKMVLSYSKANEAQVSDAIRALKERYQIKIQDVG